MDIRIRVNGVPAYTYDLAADAHGLTPDAMRKLLERAGVQPIPGATIGRQPLYAAAEVKRAVAGRLGRGAPGRPRQHRAPRPTGNA